MLPMINANPSSMDTGKQITSIKTYINTLRDAIDDELSHISYDQLDANLKKRIDAISDDIELAKEQSQIVAETVKANYLSAQEINAKYITASEVSATYASIGSLSALSARVGTIEADYVGTEYLETNYATIGALSAATARIGVIESNYITANTITADFLNARYQNASQGLYAQRIYCSEYNINYEDKSWSLRPTRVTIGSTSRIILGA